MGALTSSDRPFNFERSIFLPFAIFILFRISPNAAQLQFPVSITVDRLEDAALRIFPVDIVERLSNPRIEISTANNFSEKCFDQLTLLREGLKNGNSWALKMFDASSKIPSGILTGNRVDLGMYDECMSVDVVEGDEEIRGRHCMYTVAAERGRIRLSEDLSICVPAICESDDIREFLNDSLQKVAASVGTNVSVLRVKCSSVDPREWTVGGIVTVGGFGALLTFLIFCTICDIFWMHSSDESSPTNGFSVVRQFSFYVNARRILCTKTSPQTLPALQGIRFFSMCWVILGHAYYMHIFAPIVNYTDLFEWTTSWQSLYIMIAPFSVDTFFTMSGFLLSYLFLKEMSTGRRFNIFAFYIHRYLRLTPAFAALLLISIFILPRMGSGPLWDNLASSKEEICRKNWWSLLLYVHNYVNRGCLPHTWYLAVEMQYFWISPLILYPLARKRKIGLAILFACFVASIVGPTIIAYQNSYTSALFPNGALNETRRTMVNFYMESHVRSAPWLIGIFFGYIVFVRKGPTRRSMRWIGWILAIAAFAFCIFSQRKFQRENYVYEAIWETFYTAVARPLWSVAVAWVIYACVHGFGGPVTKLLSFSIFYPLSRLSYCMYLVHFVIQSTKVDATRVPHFFSDFGPVDDFLSDLMLSIIIGFFFSLAFESPILVLEKIVRKRNRNKTNESRKELRNENVENGIDNPVINNHK